MRELPAVPAERHGVFTSREAAAAGWSFDALDHAVRSDRIVRLDRGIYGPLVAGDEPNAVRARFAAASVAAVLACRPAKASHRSSAVLADLPLWTTPSRACVTVPPRYTGDARTAHLHRATLFPEDLLPGVVPRLRSARTIFDAARECGVEEAVVIGDAALHRRMTDLDAIHAVAARCAGWPGYRRAVATIPLLDRRAESPLESISRLRLANLGLPAPEPQANIYDRRGRHFGRVDLYWDEFGVAAEIDGKMKLEESPLEAEWNWLKRHGRLSETGLILVRWGRAELDWMPALAYRLEDAFARGLRRLGDRGWIAEPMPRFAPRVRVS